ncbi:MAG: butyrate kinase [Sedimentibacter sp.]
MYKILAINPGSTSTKIAVYEDENIIFKRSIDHPEEETSKYATVNDQYSMRYELILKVLEEENIKTEDLSCIVGRGGPAAPFESGAYILDDVLVDKLKNKPMNNHVSLLGGIIAYHMASKLSIPSYIYDAVSTDQFDDVARISGVKEIVRQSAGHALNMRAAGIKVSKEMDKKYEDLNLIIVHLGGGISVSIHKKGRMVDLISDDEGPFSPERSGGVPCRALIDMCYKHDREYMHKLLRGKGGLISYLGTSDAREVEKRIEAGDEYAKFIYEALVYQIAKNIGALAPVVDGKVDAVIITGGLAQSKVLMSMIVKKIEFISQVIVIPGENELESLSLGALRVLRGEEEAHKFFN